jgi:hypothetical protein
MKFSIAYHKRVRYNLRKKGEKKKKKERKKKKRKRKEKKEEKKSMGVRLLTEATRSNKRGQ